MCHTSESPKPCARKPDTQSGATLITALVMLVVLTLLVISAIRSSTTNMRIAGNMQIQHEAIAAAQQGIEHVLSRNFTVSPVQAASTIQIFVTATANADYAASVPPPVCNGSRAVRNSDPGIPPQCISSSTATNTGIMFAGSAPSLTGTSWCYAQVWDVTANVTDNRTGAQTELHQGVSLNVPVGTNC